MTTHSCEICGKKLTDRESIARGFGPDCAARRASFLSSCETSEAEITRLESAGADSARWIRNFRQDMRAGRVRQARQCIDAARRKAGNSIAAPAVKSVPASLPVQSEPPTPAIVVRRSERGFRVHPPYCHRPFIDAFKATVGSAWYPEDAEWFIPETCIEWTKELLEYWFSMPVYVEGQSNQL